MNSSHISLGSDGLHSKSHDQVMAHQVASSAQSDAVSAGMSDQLYGRPIMPHMYYMQSQQPASGSTYVNNALLDVPGQGGRENLITAALAATQNFIGSASASANMESSPAPTGNKYTTKLLPHELRLLVYKLRQKLEEYKNVRRSDGRKIKKSTIYQEIADELNAELSARPDYEHVSGEYVRLRYKKCRSQASAYFVKTAYRSAGSKPAKRPVWLDDDLIPFVREEAGYGSDVEENVRRATQEARGGGMGDVLQVDGLPDGGANIHMTQGRPVQRQPQVITMAHLPPPTVTMASSRARHSAAGSGAGLGGGGGGSSGPSGGGASMAGLDGLVANPAQLQQVIVALASAGMLRPAGTGAGGAGAGMDGAGGGSETAVADPRVAQAQELVRWLMGLRRDRSTSLARDVSQRATAVLKALQIDLDRSAYGMVQMLQEVRESYEAGSIPQEGLGAEFDMLVEQHDESMRASQQQAIEEKLALARQAAELRRDGLAVDGPVGTAAASTPTSTSTSTGSSSGTIDVGQLIQHHVSQGGGGGSSSYADSMLHLHEPLSGQPNYQGLQHQQQQQQQHQQHQHQQQHQQRQQQQQSQQGQGQGQGQQAGYSHLQQHQHHQLLQQHHGPVFTDHSMGGGSGGGAAYNLQQLPTSMGPLSHTTTI